MGISGLPRTAVFVVNGITFHSALAGPYFQQVPFKKGILLHPCPLQTHTVVQCPMFNVLCLYVSALVMPHVLCSWNAWRHKEVRDSTLAERLLANTFLHSLCKNEMTNGSKEGKCSFEWRIAEQNLCLPLHISSGLRRYWKETEGWGRSICSSGSGRLGAVCSLALSEQRRKNLTQWDTNNFQSSQASCDYKEIENPWSGKEHVLSICRSIRTFIGRKYYLFFLMEVWNVKKCS